MIRVVLDTNILVSATFWKGAPYRVVRMAAGGAFQNFISSDICSEFTRTLRQDFEVDQIQAEAAMLVILTFSKLVKPNIHHNVISADPDDDRILDCANESQSDFIITGDKHLLKLKTFNSASIVTPNEFLSQLKPRE